MKSQAAGRAQIISNNFNAICLAVRIQVRQTHDAVRPTLGDVCTYGRSVSGVCYHSTIDSRDRVWRSTFSRMLSSESIWALTRWSLISLMEGAFTIRSTFR